jgi:hypothetical protein
MEGALAVFYPTFGFKYDLLLGKVQYCSRKNPLLETPTPKVDGVPCEGGVLQRVYHPHGGNKRSVLERLRRNKTDMHISRLTVMSERERSSPFLGCRQ